MGYALLKPRETRGPNVFLKHHAVQAGVMPRKFTYADCLEWPEDYRAEIFNGEVIEMPSPTLSHQKICLNLVLELGIFLRRNPMGELYFAPCDVRLFPKPDLSDRYVFEPDLLVVKDKAKLDGRSCNGAPDLVVEILSPSNANYDRVKKRDVYRQAGVPEYWVVDPDAKTVTVHLLKDGTYSVTEYSVTSMLSVTVLPGCALDLSAIFAV